MTEEVFYGEDFAVEDTIIDLVFYGEVLSYYGDVGETTTVLNVFFM